ncbi:WhiB family transcriptional regulator [Kitasatospora sp. CB01950]|uniref:WhiB family transcriptional regulator n=1 Tax=Kitasatospora sp. CB01950 TaxID=1703930 RepID=UPI00093F3FC5|nr:WhiB family transcriptional regulator [Kitasatospora sp. CB01950]OKJ06815.1 hypothetical protein AMK19_23460 [Kitasatospora sp. CB01950]
MQQLPHFIPPTSAGLLPCVGQHALFDEPDTATEAAELCATCPVRTACNTWAVQHTEWGTWAGRTDNDRGTPRTELPDRRRITRTKHYDDCGTEDARRRHIGHQEQCDRCDEAYAARIRADRAARLIEEHQRPGGPTRYGYRLHLQLGVPACQACLAAHSAAVKPYLQRAA